MKGSFRFVTTLQTLVLIFNCVSTLESRSAKPSNLISIRVYKAVQIPSETLNLAIEQAKITFHSAGVDLLIDQPSIEADEDRGLDMTSAHCRQPSSRQYLVLRLIAGMPAHVLPNALGYALPYARVGAHAIIFYDRVEHLSNTVGSPSYLALGYAIAHELGHVLLSSQEHSIGGLMQGRWTAQTWHLASAGLLAFQREEKQRMCANVQSFWRREDPHLSTK
jgi:predicted metal-binding membrane protein